MLAREILNSPTSRAKAQLSGMAIGDGCVGSDVLCGGNRGPFFSIEFFHGHGQVSRTSLITTSFMHSRLT
jgi:hypothetical protein